MKTKNITISMPTDLLMTLQKTVGKREMSKYITTVVRESLEAKTRNLEAAYAQADEDEDTKEVIEDWKALDLEDWD